MVAIYLGSPSASVLVPNTGGFVDCGLVNSQFQNIVLQNRGSSPVLIVDQNNNTVTTAFPVEQLPAAAVFGNYTVLAGGTVQSFQRQRGNRWLYVIVPSGAASSIVDIKLGDGE